MSSRRTPLRGWASRLAGRLARSPASRHLIPWFARTYAADRSAALRPAGGFHNLQEFFCRQLLPGLRPIAEAPGLLVSPVDGTVGACGPVENGMLLQAKGRFYPLAELLRDPAAAAGFEAGLFCTLYLAPGDYHRVHAPGAARVGQHVHIPGSFWPVNPKAVARVSGLFASNEREVVLADGFALVLVAACLVGGIRMNRRPPYEVERGGELGRFEFGSTVILLAPRGLRLACATGDRVRMGQPLMRPAAGPEVPSPAPY